MRVNLLIVIMLWRIGLCLLSFVAVIDFAQGQTGVRLKWPTVDEVYPDFRTHREKRACFEYKEFPRRYLEWQKPSISSWLASLVPTRKPDPAKGLVEVLQLPDNLTLVKIQVPDAPDQGDANNGAAEVYKIEPQRIEFIKTWNRGGMLYATETGISKWGYEYDDDGRIVSRLYYHWAYPGWRVAKREIFRIPVKTEIHSR